MLMDIFNRMRTTHRAEVLLNKTFGVPAWQRPFWRKRKRLVTTQLLDAGGNEYDIAITWALISAHGSLTLFANSDDAAKSRLLGWVAMAEHLMPRSNLARTDYTTFETISELRGLATGTIRPSAVLQQYGWPMEAARQFDQGAPA
jgi:hypothetical protein